MYVYVVLYLKNLNLIIYRLYLLQHTTTPFAQMKILVLFCVACCPGPVAKMFLFAVSVSKRNRFLFSGFNQLKSPLQQRQSLNLVFSCTATAVTGEPLPPAVVLPWRRRRRRAGRSWPEPSQRTSHSIECAYPTQKQRWRGTMPRRQTTAKNPRRWRVQRTAPMVQQNLATN